MAADKCNKGRIHGMLGSFLQWDTASYASLRCFNSTHTRFCDRLFKESCLIFLLLHNGATNENIPKCQINNRFTAPKCRIQHPATFHLMHRDYCSRINYLGVRLITNKKQKLETKSFSTEQHLKMYFHFICRYF